MSSSSLQLPVIQNWSCHNCGGCCREHLIEITEEEKRRIDQQGWTAADGIATERPIIQKIGKGRYRLSHQNDGACVFLDDSGLCRIHAKFGEPAKPLACRVYPYAYHPTGEKSLAVSLRFSCPSVVQNLGSAVTDQRIELQKLGNQIVAGKKRDHSAPLIHRNSVHGPQQVNWPDFHRFLKAFDVAFADTSVDFVVRLMRVLSWLELVEQSQFQTIKGDKLNEFLELVTNASVKAQPDNDLPLHRPGRLAKVMFRLLTAQHARHDTEADVRSGLSMRLNLLSAALKYTTGFGTVPVLHGSQSAATAFEDSANTSPEQHRARFAELEGEFNCRTAGIDELFTRYFRVKIQGIHFCGPANFNTTLVEGFHGLALMYPIVLWLARLRAVRNNRSTVSLVDVQTALATADHNFAYSPALGLKSALQRVSLLAKMKQLTSLIGWYSR